MSKWKQWLSFNPYKKLWSLVGGRPWTYIMRDFYHRAEYFIIVGGLIGGYYLRTVLTEREFLLTMVGLTVGYILGHLFWAKKYIPDQPGD